MRGTLVKIYLVKDGDQFDGQSHSRGDAATLAKSIRQQGRKATVVSIKLSAVELAWRIASRCKQQQRRRKAGAK